MTAVYWRPRAKAADVVDCRFPEEIGTPGPKERPALVLQVEDAADDGRGCVVVVAYASSQKTARVYAGEFVIKAGGQAGLTADTKFDLVNRHRLPFDDVWFGPAAGTTPPHPRRGRLDLDDLETKRKLHSAILSAESARKKSRT